MCSPSVHVIVGFKFEDDESFIKFVSEQLGPKAHVVKQLLKEANCEDIEETTDELLESCSRQLGLHVQCVDVDHEGYIENAYYVGTDLADGTEFGMPSIDFTTLVDDTEHALWERFPELEAQVYILATE